MPGFRLDGDALVADGKAMRPAPGIIAALLYGFCTVTGAAVDSHCENDEMIVFNCSVGKKIVSVCASQPVSASSGYIQYRFGRKGAVELIHPPEKNGSRASLRANTLTFSGGGGAYIRFSQNRYSYVVYTAVGRGWGDKAGIAVEKDQRLQVNLPCKMPVVSEMGPDFFDQAGLPKDPIGFELP